MAEQTTKAVRFEILSCSELSMAELSDRLYDLQTMVAPIMNRTMLEELRYYDSYERFKESEGRAPTKEELPRRSKITYDWAREEYRDLGSQNVSAAQKVAEARFRNDKFEVLVRASKTLASFRDTGPIYLNKQGIRLRDGDGQAWCNTRVFSRENKWEHPTSLNVRLDLGDGSKGAIWDRLLDGTYTMGDPMLKPSQPRWRKRAEPKWFLIVPYSFEVIPAEVDPDRLCGVDVGVNNAFSCAVSDKWETLWFSLHEVKHFQAQIKRRRRQIQATGRRGANRAGHGRKKLLKPIETLAEKERNFRSTKNHQYSRQIVDFAIAHGAGTIVVEKKLSNDAFPWWPWSDLHTKIEQKAAEVGIAVQRVDAYYTSQRCFRCGHIDRANRPDQATFKCVSCGYRAHADANAARNLATPGIEQLIADSRKERDKQISANPE